MSRGVRIGVAALAVIALLALGIVWGRGWWRYHQTHVSTDDAYVHADVAQVTSRVPGTIVELAVEENWRVRPGDLLVRLDRQPLEVKLRKAEATLAAARARVNEMRAAVQAAESEVRLAEAEYEQARLEHTRAEKLAGQGAAPATRLDRSRTDLRAAEARLASARRGVEEARAGLGVPVGAPADEAPVVRQAQAALEEAQLFLSYTDLRAPLGGVVARRSVEIGQRVESGQPLMMIVPLDRVYVQANFKETELADVRIGQPATVVADLYPRHVFRGRVQSLSPGSGAAFALLPPENASGNWVKVVQRVPVRIALDDPPPGDHPLRIGLSVAAAIDVSDKRGSLLDPGNQAVAER